MYTSLPGLTIEVLLLRLKLRCQSHSIQLIQLRSAAANQNAHLLETLTQRRQA